MRIVLADREAEIMDVLWDRGPSTVSEVKEAVPDELAYTTVLTILRKLEAKKYVGHDAEGKAHRYKALVEREAARSSALRDLAAKFFKGSAGLLMTQLVSDHKLSEEELKRIRKLLSQRAKERE
ncbi:MAG TPA: BlaI/MecI/CopY family transcriptional regulator [Steroidobacteraceae bacterium]|jgi:predicted transcriptional regulator